MTAKELYEELGKERYDKKNMDVYFVGPRGVEYSIASISADEARNVALLSAEDAEEGSASDEEEE